MEGCGSIIAQRPFGDIRSGKAAVFQFQIVR
jgi:hypothetical protein